MLPGVASGYTTADRSRVARMRQDLRRVRLWMGLSGQMLAHAAFLVLAAVGLPFPSATAVEPPLAYWPFEAGPADASGNDLALIDPYRKLVPVPGVVGKALAFTVEARDYLRAANHVQLPLEGDFTISAWVKAAAGSHPEAVQGLVGRFGYDGHAQFDVRLVGMQVTALLSTDGTKLVELKHRRPLDVDAWHHLALVWRAATKTATLHVSPKDGKTVDPGESKTLDAPLHAAKSTPFTVGFSQFGGAFFNGEIDEVAVWRKSLTAAEIGTVFERGTAGNSLLGGSGPYVPSSAAIKAAEEAAVPARATGEPLAVGEVPVLEVESLGPTTGGPMTRVFPAGRANDQSPWKQIVFFKKDARTVHKSYFACVDFAKGSVRELPVCVPSLEAWTGVWVDGKFWIGMGVPARLAVYDPATDVLTDLGAPFESEKPALHLYSLAASPDGVLALGGGQGGTDLATYDPKSGTFTQYGQVAGPENVRGWVYYVSMDERFIYCAIRGMGPCELISVNRSTKERKVLATRPNSGFIHVVGNLAELTAENQNKVYLLLENGNAEEISSEQRQGRVTHRERSGFTGTAPEIFFDDSLIAKGEPTMLVLVPDPAAEGKFVEGRLPIALAGETILDLAALPDGRIAGVARGYGPTVIADPGDRRHELVQTRTSGYCIVAVGKMLFISGYPNARLMVYDTTRPQTSTLALPGRPAVPQDDPGANPRQVAALASVTGGAHIGVCLTPAADGRVYLAARRHRYHDGFALASCDSEGNEVLVFDDAGAFNHLQIGWMSAADKGDRLLIATFVKHNDQAPGDDPNEGALFIYDVKARKIAAKHVPLPNVKALLGVVQTGPNEVVGVGQLGDGSSVLYRLNLETGKTEQTRTVRATVCGTASGELSVPCRSNAFVVGPDGWVWAGAIDDQGGTLFVRVNPRDLSTRVVGRLNDTFNRLLFSGGEIYTTGGSSVQRLKNWRTAANDPPAQ